MAFNVRLNEEQAALCTKHHHLVFWFASKWRANYSILASDELVSAAQLGLMRACFEFDEDKGVKFSTFATKWMHFYASTARLVERRRRKPYARQPNEVEGDEFPMEMWVLAREDTATHEDPKQSREWKLLARWAETLDRKTRKAILLRMDGLDRKEIGIIMGLHAKNVSVRLRAAARRLGLPQGEMFPRIHKHDRLYREAPNVSTTFRDQEPE